MDRALAAARTAPLSLRRLETSRRQQVQFQSLHHPSCRSSVGHCIVSCSINLPNPGHFGLPRGTSDYLNKLSEAIRRYVPQPLKEFPWKKAEDLALQRLLTFGKWSLAAFLVLSFLSDVFMSLTINKELIMPAGLFTGVVVAQFVKEVYKELNEQEGKDFCSRINLYNMGFIFVVAKLVLLCATSPGSYFLRNVCNGGLLKVLWLVKETQETGNTDAESSTSISV